MVSVWLKGTRDSGLHIVGTPLKPVVLWVLAVALLTGSGAAEKIISTMVTATLLAAAGEGLALGERLGLDRSQVANLLTRCRGGGRPYLADGPRAAGEVKQPD